jgi:hypothetical protein
MNFLDRLEVPAFDEWASPHETAKYLRKIGQPEKAEAAIRWAAGTPDKVVYILTDPWVGGFKERWVTGVSYVDVNTIGTRFQREVIVHEWLHNAHEKRWQKIDVPGWDTLTDERKKIIYPILGIDDSFGEVDGIEALTQFATQKKIGETESGYDAKIVPQGIRLFETLGKKSGRSTVGAFLNMALHGSTGGKQEFADGVRTGGNIIMFEKALAWKVLKPEETAQNMSNIIEFQKTDFVVRDMEHAEKFADSYLKAIKTVWVSPLVVEENKIAKAA